MTKVLIAGESWMTTTTHTKGVDDFTVSSYTEGGKPLIEALRRKQFEVDYMPGHLVPTQFPGTQAELDRYDAIILSDIGANSLQLAPDVFERFIPGSDRVAELAKWVRAGGGLLMVGGYLSFSGFQARAAYRQTDIAAVLPVKMLPEDDRVERPSGIVPEVLDPTHPALGASGATWPQLLGYNRTILKTGAISLATIGNDPLVAVQEVEAGRTAVFTSDCSPHWAPPAFCEEWDGYEELFGGLVGWVSKSI